MKKSRQRRVRTRRERMELGFSFLVSLLIHLLLLLMFALLLLLEPRETEFLTVEELPETPVEVTFLPAPGPTPQQSAFIDSTALTEAEAPPEEARFESDRDTVAASEESGRGPSDLPTQEGRDSEFLELADQQLALGDIPQPARPSMPETPPSTPAEEISPAEPEQESAPEPTPEPTPEVTPEPTPQPTPTPPEDVLALQRPPEVRRAEPVAPESVRQEVRRPEAVRPPQPGSPGFQPERRVTRIEGGVSNRGPASVAALATPLGRYKKALSDAIGSRWYFYVRNEIGLLAVGTTTIRFQVMASGRVTGIQVLTNSSNESFAAISIRSIMDAEIPPIPPEVSELLENNRIEVDYTFSILSN